MTSQEQLRIYWKASAKKRRDNLIEKLGITEVRLKEAEKKRNQRLKGKAKVSTKSDDIDILKAEIASLKMQKANTSTKLVDEIAQQVKDYTTDTIHSFEKGKIVKIKFIGKIPPKVTLLKLTDMLSCEELVKELDTVSLKVGGKEIKRESLRGYI